MGTVADKLAKLSQTKEAIRQALVEKGQEVSTDTPFSGYPEKISAIQTVGGAVPADPLDPVAVYRATRPSDWLRMPEPADDEMYLLFHIPDGVSSLLAFTATCTGSYTVELGTVANGQFVQQSATEVASGETYEAELLADDYGDLTSTGMKQVMVKVSGEAITEWLADPHSKKADTKFFDWNIVEISCRLPDGEYITPSGLRKLRYYTQYTPSVDMCNMFWECVNLVAIPQLNTSGVDNLNLMFTGCTSLKAIPLLDTSAATNMEDMFKNCTSLETIPLLDTSQVTSMDEMFYGCTGLKTIPALDTSAVTNMHAMFYGCTSLVTIPALDTSAVTNMNMMFENCVSLVVVPAINTSGRPNTASAFENCPSLTKILFCPDLAHENIGYLEIRNACLGHQAIVALLNSLPTLINLSGNSVRTLILTGNPGVAELTEEEKAIATGKNWKLAL